jgi:mannitol-1-phosphate 5-dehydrogenase
MKAIQFGAGNIGRGFIGAVLAGAGYELVFADVVEELLSQINYRKEYVVHVSDHNSYDVTVKGVRAVNSGSDEAVSEIVDADIITTAVGLRILKFVAPTVAKGIIARQEAGIGKPLNIIACESASAPPPNSRSWSSRSFPLRPRPGPSSTSVSQMQQLTESCLRCVAKCLWT